MRLAALLGLFGAACTFDASGVADGDAGRTDGAELGDASRPDASPACAGWEAVHFEPCVLPATETNLDLGGGAFLYDTDAEGFVDAPEIEDPPVLTLAQGGQSALIVAVESLRVRDGARLRVVGARPLILAASGDIDVEGGIDAGSRSDGAGAGASAPACDEAGAGDAGADGSSGAPGGGGGGFGGGGGDGGDGDTNRSPTGGAQGGPAAGPPAIVRGGCAGGDGGASDGAGGAGGEGGGAIQLTSATRIRVSGVIHAGGGGGAGAPLGGRGGGGGGGSGGYVGLDAPRVEIEGGVLAANGGGGGEGAGLEEHGTPEDGDDAVPTADPTPGGAGGAEDPDGGDGGPGGAGDTSDGGPGDAARGGGGGGGGGVGFVLIWSPDHSTSGDPLLSPPPTINPTP